MAEETETAEREAPAAADAAEVVVACAEEKPAVTEAATPPADPDAEVPAKTQAVEEEEKPAVREATAPPADPEADVPAETQAAEEEKPAVTETGVPPANSEADAPAKPQVVEEKAALKEAAPGADVPMKPHAMEEPTGAVAAAAGKKKGAGVPLSVYFKEESNVVEDLEDSERKALDELKQLVRAALTANEFTRPPPPPPPPPKPEELASEAEVKEEDGRKETEEMGPTKPGEPSPPAIANPAVVTTVAEEKKAVVVDDDGAKTVEAIAETVVPVAPAAPARPPLEAEKAVAEVSLWGVPLLRGETSDTVLLKFLRARDFKVGDALSMLKNTVMWRREFGIDELLQEDLRLPELERAVFMHGKDKEGHPVCYNVYGVLQEKGVYNKVFGDEAKRERFLRWRIQVLEKGIRDHLNFGPTGVCSMVQVTDLKDSPGIGRWELRQAMKKALGVLQDNYPEFVSKQVFINVPWWYLAFNRMISPFFTQRTKSKFVFAGPSRSFETLFEYIAPEQVPVQFGGLSTKDDPDFTISDAITEVTIKPSSKHAIVFPASEACLIVWELRVLGWEVSYGAEFVPSAEGGYTVIVQKERKFAPTDEALLKNSFRVGEPGKVVVTVDNATSRKKKLLYRCKTRKFT